MATGKEWGDALQGMGAFFSGQGPQYMYAKAEEDRRAFELSEERKRAWVLDMGQAVDLAKAGEVGPAIQLFQNRLENIERLDGDPSHTAGMLRLLQEGRVDEFVAGAEPIVQRGMRKFGIETGDKAISTKGGQVIYQGANGPYAKQVEGWDPAMASSGGSAASLGMTRLFKDETGNLFYGANIFDKTTGQMRVDMVPTSGDPNTKPSGSVMPVDPYGNNAAERVGQKAAESQAGESGKLSAQLSQKPEVEAAVKAAVDQVTTTTKKGEAGAANSTALEVYDIAMNGLVEALGGTTTGPIAGWMPALTDNAQIAGGAVAAMAPVLKQIFRQAGEGIFTDKDQALLMEMVPTRKDRPAAAVAKIKNIDKIVRAKLGAEGPVPDRFGDQPTPATPSGGGKLMVDANGNRAMVYPDGRIEEVQ